MVGIALTLALEVAAQFVGLPLARVPIFPEPGVDLRAELRLIGALREDGKVIVGAPERKTIALTFDDGPHPKTTPRLLRELDALDVKASFFVVGKMVDKYPWLARAEVAAGHDVGNHTYDHVNLNNLTEPQIESEYRAANDAIERATGTRPRFCRPPGGRFDSDAIRAAEDEGLWTVLWTDDPGDFARPDPKLLVDRIDRQMKSGGILLLHDGIPQTMDILPQLVKELRSRGYRFVTCSELLAESQRTALDHGGINKRR